MAHTFQGKNILVTGGSRGTGRAIAISLARKGANVYVLAKTRENLDKLAKEEPSIRLIRQDLGDWEGTRHAVEKIDTLDGLVNCAAVILPLTPVTDVLREDIDLVVDVNLKAVINIMQVVAKKMIIGGKGGSIVNISSNLSNRALKGVLAYTVSKAGVDMATKVFALEMGPHKIRVNTVNPTLINTEMAQSYGKEFLDHSIAQIPAGRMCEVEDVADAVLFLLSDQSKMISGTSITVDGGQSCYLPV